MPMSRFYTGDGVLLQCYTTCNDWPVPVFLLLGRKPRLSIDVYLGWTPAEDGYTSAGNYLSRHQIMFQEVHRLASSRIFTIGQEASPVK
ncbi:hypothetical protein RRG08_025556 [Elysia crispata]|uniref:Uncharacterized protein n=1 Tax=Elysia crispata TaxID=231223 RepID=A0AAE0ZGU2_9GAST|nr:hypothetical protein RRG08_025556 [Elysia crispata]